MATQERNEAAALTPGLFVLTVFVEGFASVGAEILALRRLVPHLGSTIVVTAPTIGFFLLALALGYRAGGQVAGRYLEAVRTNFLVAAVLIGGGLSHVGVSGLFAQAIPDEFAYLLLVALILCPIAYLLGQTVPILTNLLQQERVGARSAAALYWSTLGSFAASVGLSLFVMQRFGVSWAGMLCSGLLLAAFLLLPGGVSRARNTLVAILAGAALAPLNLAHRPTAETAYATYGIDAVQVPGMIDPLVLRANNSSASLIDRRDPPQYARYIDRLRQLLRDELGYRDKHVLVLGAGGFTLSHGETANRYTYVDIDPAIKPLAEERFLRGKVRGDFVAADARRFLVESARRGAVFDAAVVDVYAALNDIPAHLATQEFWRDTRKVLAQDGLLAANLILDTRLLSDYARNMLATIESVYGRCAVEVLFRDRDVGNVLVLCFNGAAPPGKIYTDELNGADVDLARSRRERTAR